MPSYEDYVPTLRLQPAVAVSPDGQWVAYIDDGLGQFNAVVQPLAGGPPRRVTSYQDSRVVDVDWFSRRGESVADWVGDDHRSRRRRWSAVSAAAKRIRG